MALLGLIMSEFIEHIYFFKKMSKLHIIDLALTFLVRDLAKFSYKKNNIWIVRGLAQMEINSLTSPSKSREIMVLKIWSKLHV